MTQVLVTRPEQVAEPLLEAIHHLGLTPVSFPTIDIRPFPQTIDNQPSMVSLPLIDIFIFVSQNAVSYGLSVIRDILYAKDLSRKTWAAIGPQTAKALAARGVPVKVVPEAHHSTSEGLLEQADLQNVMNKHVMIIKGRGGREQLKSSLLSRGAQVHEYIVYERCLPSVDSRPIQAALLNQDIRLIVITSGESLDNLIQLLSPLSYDTLTAVTLLVISPRLAEYALARGFQSIIQADSAATADICRAIRVWQQSCHEINSF